ncbi:MAG TPA: hypothetical protein VL326_18625 [Kofleriaceae bacterium]|nr:hypothetical protein [Kofleriaceae bacterium]
MLLSRAGLLSVALFAGCGRIAFDAATGTGASDAQAIDTPALVPAYVQGRGLVNGNAASFSYAFAQPVTAGNTGIIVVDYVGGGVSLTSLTDTVGTQYAAVVHESDNTIGLNVWYGRFPASGMNTVTATLDASVNPYDLRLHEFSGLAATNAADMQMYASGTVASPGPISVGPVTTTAPNELAFATVLCELAQATGGTNMTEAFRSGGDLTEYAIVPTQQPFTATADVTTAGDYWLSVVTFRPGP